MEILKKPFQEVPQFSSKDTAYATAHPNLRPFYKYEVSLDSFSQVIQDKQQQAISRVTLVSSLEEQYASIPTSEKVKENIQSLAHDHTFTVITAHQPSLFTGPLYYIFKIISAIRLSEDLNEQYPDYHFVPVFISGSEDHDFEEINHTQLFGKRLTWKNDEQGACGMMKTESLQEVLGQLKDILGSSDNAQKAFALIEDAYTRFETYGQATQYLVNSLFQEFGLVVANMNTPTLKRLMIPYFEKEIFEELSHPLVTSTQHSLEEAGFGGQVHVRPINVFYLRDQIRARIEKDGAVFKIVDTDYEFTEAALRAELQEHPERFSPNVVMRPIYQELIFPNLAYIGGGGELAYWLERKSQFEALGLNFPMLIRRNSALWVDKGSVKKLNKLDLSIHDLFQDEEPLVQSFVAENTENEINLNDEKSSLASILLQVSQKAKEVDPSLEKKVLAENAKIINSIEKLEGRLMRAEKQKYETSLNQIRGLKEKFFPGNGLQERYDNFLPLYLKYGQDLFHTLKAELNPLERGMVIFLEE